MKQAAILCVVLTSIVLGGCASYEGSLFFSDTGTVRIESTDISNVKRGASRAIIEQSLGEPVRKEREGSWTVAEYKYQIGGEATFSRGKLFAGGSSVGGNDPLGIFAWPIVLPLAWSAMAAVDSNKAWRAKRDLLSTSEQSLTVLYSADEKAQWIGQSVLSARTFQKANTGDPAAQLEVGVKSLKAAERWKWVCRSANQGHGPALSMLERGHSTDYAAMLLNPKLVRIAREVDDDLNRKAVCDPEKPFELDMSRGSETLRNINIPDVLDRSNHSKFSFGWLRIAAKCGVADAQDWLGLRFQEGEGTAKKLPEAYFWYGLAQRFAKTKFDRLLADFLRPSVREQLTPAQIAEAEKRVEMWRRDPAACATRFGPPEQLALYCSMADLEAQYMIGFIHELGFRDHPVDPVRAYVWYSIAEKNGEAASTAAKESVAATLTPEQLAEAERLVADWKPGQCEAKVKRVAEASEAATQGSDEPSATSPANVAVKAKEVRKSRAEIERNWRERIEAVKREGPYEDCEGATAASLSDCEDRSDKIERLREEMGRELASQSCPAGSQIDFSRDREAIEEVLSTYFDTSEGINQSFHEFRDITERNTQCGEIKVTAVYTMDHAYPGGAGMPNEPYTREAVFIKKNNKFYVSRVGN